MAAAAAAVHSSRRNEKGEALEGARREHFAGVASGTSRKMSSPGA